MLRRGARNCETARLLRRQDLEHSGPAHGTDTLQRGAAVGHLHLLGVRDLPLRLTLHAVTFIRGHRALCLCHCLSLLQFGARRGTGSLSARQHNKVVLGGGNLAVLKAITFVRSVTKRFYGRAPTSAQHNDFRRFAVFPGRGCSYLPVGRHDPHRPVDDEGAIGPRSDGHMGHAPQYRGDASPPDGVFSRVRSTMHTRLSLIVCGAALAACLGERGPFTNRMAHSGTSYLARAARQPVRWQPWGRDAFALAAKLDRPVLLYIGSDDCRWCAETDRAIYTNPEIGSLINTLFVPIRVDRDERPDVAQRYQTAVEHLAGL